jgi:hypothetical protein
MADLVERLYEAAAALQAALDEVESTAYRAANRLKELSEP